MRLIILNDQLSIVAGRDGYFLVNRNDVYIGRALEIYGEYNGLEGGFLKRLIKPGDHVVEVGANIGAHTVGLAKAVGAQGRVSVFEPQRACYGLLQSQIALNQLDNVFAYNSAVGRERGQLWLPSVNYFKPGNFGAVKLSRDQTPNSEAAGVVTLDEHFGDQPCALIKIDVEGMEEDVIRGGLDLIRNRRPLLYVENDLEKSKSLVSLLLELGYRIWWHIPMLFNADNFYGNSQNAYGGTASFNMFCCQGDHEAANGLVEIKSPDDPHPAAPKAPMSLRVSYRLS
jgi:FkbM family methyltransferase